MHLNLQPKAISSQELTVIGSFTTLGCMDEPEKHAFAARLNELCDEPQFGIPAAGKGRQVTQRRGPLPVPQAQSVPVHP